jgi:hypothetical protein
MRRAFSFRSLLVVAVVVASVALAQAPKSAGAIALCSPPTNDVCVNKQCQCSRITCSRCGVSSFTCSESTGASTCVCKTC